MVLTILGHYKIKSDEFNKFINKNDLILIISNLKNNNAPTGPDKLTLNTLKNILSHIIAY